MNIPDQYMSNQTLRKGVRVYTEDGNLAVQMIKNRAVTAMGGMSINDIVKATLVNGVYRLWAVGKEG